MLRRATALTAPPVLRRATALTVTLLLLAACGSDADDPAPIETTAASVVGEVPTISGAYGEEPTVEVPASDPGTELYVEVLEPGDGAALAEGELVVADFYGKRWAASASDASAEPSAEASANPDVLPDGVIDSTFSNGSPQSFALSSGSVMPGWYEGLVGQTIGSRVLVVIPPDKGLGAEGNPDFGIAPGDTLVFVFDLIEAFGADAAAEGASVDVPVDATLPTVTDGDDGPEITVPSDSPPPTELVTQTLITGAGDAVRPGQLIVVQYRGVLWKDGAEFDSSWSRGAATGFAIGVSLVIPGWDKGLVGQTAGSRVLLVIPPAEGYGPEGSPPTIAGDDTLVFVVDILGAYGDAA